MLEVYSHLSGKDVDDKILALHGIRLKDPSFIQGLVKNKEFLEALRKALTAT